MLVNFTHNWILLWSDLLVPTDASGIIYRVASLAICARILEYSEGTYIGVVVPGGNLPKFLN